MIRRFVQSKIKSLAARWMNSEEALVTVEAALVFPILLTLLMGTFDMGNAILANQKAIRSSQVVADLITRSRTVGQTDIDEAVEAGRLAFETLTSDSYGVDIVSVRFDEDALPAIVWRETSGNISANPNVLEAAGPLAEENSGVVVVTVEYVFEPLFAGFVIDQVPMQEIAFARGRKSAVVNKQ